MPFDLFSLVVVGFKPIIEFKATLCLGTHQYYSIDGITLGMQSYSQIMIGIFNHLVSIVFRFHYHSQDVIGSLGQ